MRSPQAGLSSLIEEPFHHEGNSMYQDNIRPAPLDGFGTMAFSDRVTRLCAAGTGQSCRARAAGLDEALAALGVARRHLGHLVPDSVAAAAIRHNRQIFQLLDGKADKELPSFLAFLPLNDRGARAMVSGHFDGGDPDLSLVSREGEPVAAIYIWLIFSPGSLVTTLRALAPLLRRLAPAGCPLFTRAVTGHTFRLFPAMGFVPARSVYMQAPEDLLALPARTGFPDFRPGPLAEKPGDGIDVRIARSMEDMMKCFTVRAATYMAEQECPYEEEFDGNDFCATHFLGEIGGEPAGCIRVRYFGDFVKIERLAVRQEHRTSRLAFRLVREALGFCRQKGFRRAYGHSRHDLTRFWGLFGFRPIAGRASFCFSDVEYVELEAVLEASDDSIAIGADPYIMIRPEGAWHRPGPLDLSSRRPDAGRQQRVDARMRKLRAGADTEAPSRAGGRDGQA